MLDGAYYTNLLGDDVVAKSFVPQVAQPGIMEARSGGSPASTVHETVILPENGEKLVGFAAHPSGMAVAMRYLVPAADTTRPARSPIPRPASRSATCATPRRSSNRVFVTVECLYGFKAALADGIKRIVKP